MSLRSALSTVGLVALAASAVVASGAFDLRARLFGSVVPERRPPAAGRVAGAAATGEETTVLRSQPWWQQVDEFDGRGDATTEAFTISRGALQWRVTWTCETGRLLVQAEGDDEPLLDESCPAGGEAYATRTGAFRLEVEADGPWAATVHQQIDVPLEEPPLPQMTSPGARVVARSEVYGMERTGTGEMILYRLRNGRHAIRLEDFYVTPNIDLELHFSARARPRTTEDYSSAGSAFVARLPITAGSLNFLVPRAVNPSRYGSLVVWCPPLRVAYAAATLRSGD